MTESECHMLESTARDEHKELTDTYKALAHEYKALRQLSVFTNLHSVLLTHSRAFEENRPLVSRLAAFKKLFRSATQAKQDLNSLVLEVNHQEELAPAELDLISRVAAATTYKFSCRSRALSYDRIAGRLDSMMIRPSHLENDSLRRVRRAMNRVSCG